MQYPKREIWNKLIKLKYELNNNLQKKVEYALFCSNQKYFEQGERAGKILAHRVKQRQASNLMPSIFDHNNKLISDKKAINEVFQNVLPKIIYITRKL